MGDGMGLSARTWIECTSTNELAALVSHARARYGSEIGEPEPGRRWYIQTWRTDFAGFEEAQAEGLNQAYGLLVGFRKNSARVVRVDVFEPDAPNLAVLNAQVMGVSAGG